MTKNRMHIFPVLETERLKLIEINNNHLYDIYNIFNDDRVTRFYNIKTFTKVEDAQIYLDWFINRFKDGLGIRWGIQRKNETELIGTIGFNHYTTNHRSNIGYDLKAEYWNHGYMTEALSLVINYGFEHLNVNRIEGEVMVGNVSSEKVLSKLGFQKEGVLREWMYWDKRHWDMILYSLLRKDYSNK